MPEELKDRYQYFTQTDMTKLGCRMTSPLPRWKTASAIMCEYSCPKRISIANVYTIPNIDPVAFGFEIAGRSFDIHWYALTYVHGISVGVACGNPSVKLYGIICD